MCGGGGGGGVEGPVCCLLNCQGSHKRMHDFINNQGYFLVIFALKLSYIELPVLIRNASAKNLFRFEWFC